MFVNFSNHSSALWGEDQLAAAHIYGEITDIPFPDIDPSADERQIFEKAALCAEKIAVIKPSAVLVQGEMTFCFAVVAALKSRGIKALCATTERRTVSSVNEREETVKTSTFRFVRFREYFGSG